MWQHAASRRELVSYFIPTPRIIPTRLFELVMFGCVCLCRCWYHFLTDQYRHIWVINLLMSTFWPLVVAVLTIGCRRFDQRSSPFWPMTVAVLTNDCRRFDLCTVAVLTTVVAVFVVAVLDLSPLWSFCVYQVQSEPAIWGPITSELKTDYARDPLLCFN